MERSSWPGHFRNAEYPARLASASLFEGRWTSKPASPLCNKWGPWWDGRSRMNRRVQDRGSWRVGACALLGIALGMAAFASSTSTTTPASSTRKQAPKPKQTNRSSKTGSSQKAAHPSNKQTSTSTIPKKKSSHGKKGPKSTRSSRKRGQQVIDHERARAIQEALIREHYLQGAPTGSWDSTTQAAMQRYQADQGWQSKTTPDSRALIKLGLGPSNDHLLNPESAMTSKPLADPKSAPKQDPPADTTPH